MRLAAPGGSNNPANLHLIAEVWKFLYFSVLKCFVLPQKNHLLYRTETLSGSVSLLNLELVRPDDESETFPRAVGLFWLRWLT
jgi:hypothetical protein